MGTFGFVRAAARFMQAPCFPRVQSVTGFAGQAGALTR